jgi:hypothetical protein
MKILHLAAVAKVNHYSPWEPVNLFTCLFPAADRSRFVNGRALNSSMLSSSVIVW